RPHAGPAGRRAARRRPVRTALLVVLLAVGLLAVLSCAGMVLFYQHVGEQIIALPIQDPPAHGPGWVELFNGKNLHGWSEVGSRGTWHAADGILRAIGRPGYLVSDRSYTTFHLKAEVRISPDTDFGILFHTDRVVANATVPTAHGHGVKFTYLGPVGDVEGHLQ